MHTFLVILDAVGYVGYHISLTGYWSDKVLVWSWLLFTFVFIILYINKKIVKIYSVLLGLVLILSFIPFGLFFFSFLTFMRASDRDFSYRVAPNIRVQEILRSPMAPPTIEIVSEQTILEKVVAVLPNELYSKNNSYFIKESSSIKMVTNEQNSTIVQIHFKDGTIIQQKVKLRGG